MIDQFLDKKYRKGSYNCGHFTADVWYFLTGERKYQLCEQNLQSSVFSLIRLNKEQEPCIVLMRAGELHSGIYYRGFVYHLLQSGVQSDTIENLKLLYSLSFYK